MKRLFPGIAYPAALTILLLVGVNDVIAQQTQPEREHIMTEINKDIHNEEALQNAIRAGKERSVLCGHCHGVDGNSLKPDIPNLASQNTAYIVEQIGKFANGDRKNFVMQTLANNFTFKDKVNLALYFNSQKVKPTEVNPELAARGKVIYKNVCFRCHGEDGKGEKGYARLAGQKTEYVMMTLKRFRANARNTNDPEDTKRHSATMEMVAVKLEDGDIESLAHYITMLK